MIQRIEEKENSIAIYVRVSTDEQAKNGFSIRDQRIKLEEVIVKSQIGGVHNTRYYIDEGYTGTNMDRPAFKRLISDIKKGKVNLVMAVDAERIGRENEYNSFWLKFLQAYMCEFYLHEDPSMDIYTDTGVLQYQIKSAFSEYEVKKIRKRTEAGIIRSFLEGNYASPHSPFGYNKKNGKLIINKEEADLVRTIHEIYLKDGMSIIGTAQYLNFNKLGESRWTENKVRKILYNMVYIGEVHRKDLGQVFLNSAPLLISKELKEDVLKKLSCNTRNTLTSSKHKFLDKVFCSECSNRCICDTHYRKDRVYRYYECKNCKLRINENDILEMISPEITEYLLEEVSNNLQKTIRKKITEFRRHQVSLNDMFDSGYIGRDTYSREMASLSKSRSDYLRKKEIELNQKITLESMTIKESGKLIKRVIKQIRINLKTKRIVKLEFI